MTIYDICMELAEIERKLDYGEIPFVYDNLMSAMKQGHPVEILDEIIAPIFYPAMAHVKPDIKKVKTTLSGLKRFQKAFKVDLKKQIKDLEQYINDESGDVNA